MNQVLRPKTQGKPRILMAPLDWGLGHTTRCIPIIRELLAQGCEVFLAGNGPQASLLSAEFPGLDILPLEGYNVKYGRSAAGLLRAMIFQIPKMLRSIRKEHAWLQSAAKQYEFDAVISDNRFGLYHPSIPCVFITHQLLIKSGLGKLVEKISGIRNYGFINRYTECWVPDLDGENNLAGELSHPLKKPRVPLRYIGILSRLKKSGIKEKKNHLLIILSGPEPQRSILEEKIIRDVSHYNWTATIARGLPDTASLIPSTNMIHFFNHLSAEEMSNAMMEAEYIIGRSGYSSIMDIMTLQKKSILIPTPGQPEQEYLGKYMDEKKWAVCLPQADFSLEKALAEAVKTDCHIPSFDDDGILKETIEEFLRKIRKGHQ
jgi:UDP-N-acetylglucosamine transferase subunit ALG13